MVFASDIFLFAFLPIFLAVYTLLPLRLRSLWIAVGSYVFYGWWRPDFVLLMWVSTVLDYSAGLGIVRDQGNGRTGKRWLLLSLVGNLGLLAYFKYANFAVETANAALGLVGAAPVPWTEVILPVGISFYTFQTMSYTIDLYRREVSPARRFTDFMGYVSLFPQLVAGPIVRYADVAAQLVAREHSLRIFSEGAWRFFVGLCRKVLIADAVASVADAAFALPNPTMVDAWLGAVAYAVQLYFDFAGYSEMAIGLGLMLGFRFMENFNHPYISRSITEFWQRWHISLSTWLRDYLYVPLGGNRKGARRTYVNLAIVMLLGGLWHGASWNFLVWGAWHGGLLALERRLSVGDDGRRRPLRLPIPLVMALVLIGWVFFRAEDLPAAGTMLAGMFGANGLWLSAALEWQLRGWSMAMLAVGLVVIYGEPALAARGHVFPRLRPAIVLLALLAISRLAAQDYTPFLYFRF